MSLFGKRKPLCIFQRINYDDTDVIINFSNIIQIEKIKSKDDNYKIKLRNIDSSETVLTCGTEKTRDELFETIWCRLRQI